MDYNFLLLRPLLVTAKTRAKNPQYLSDEADPPFTELPLETISR